MVTMGDVRARGWCVSGAREFGKRYSLDWRTFLREGLPCEVMLATGDDLARQLVDDVRNRESCSGQG